MLLAGLLRNQPYRRLLVEQAATSEWIMQHVPDIPPLSVVLRREPAGVTLHSLRYILWISIIKSLTSNGPGEKKEDNFNMKWALPSVLYFNKTVGRTCYVRTICLQMMIQPDPNIKHTCRLFAVKHLLPPVWIWRKLLCQHQDILYIAVQTYFLLWISELVGQAGNGGLNCRLVIVVSDTSHTAIVSDDEAASQLTPRHKKQTHHFSAATPLSSLLMAQP